jgi:tRNA-dihydrouridine synthase A
MMDRTDKHFRYMMRLLAPDIRLYTEMVTADAVLRGNRERLLAHDPAERPLALQLGGGEPEILAEAAAIADQRGFDELNLNVGCPSDRVQSGRFGACLMAHPALVADCIAAMRAETRLPVTVKTRIGIDHHDNYEFLARFVEQVIAAGCKALIVHARKAILSGLSPRENRQVPPLRYDLVYRLKQDFPGACIVLNGGVRGSEDATLHLRHVDGVMVGRQAYAEPYVLAALQENLLCGSSDKGWRPPDREQLVRLMARYAERQIAQGARLHHVTRHMAGLFAGQRGARRWRRDLGERCTRVGAGPEQLLEALAVMDIAA